MENFEKQQSRLENQEFIDKFIDVYANELEKMVTEPGSGFSEDELEIVNKFRKSKKLPRAHKWFHDLLVRVGQDFRLTPDEIDILRDKFLE
jgi:hypothetical protein